jgi:hypothetical protein
VVLQNSVSLFLLLSLLEFLTSKHDVSHAESYRVFINNLLEKKER